MQHHPLIEWHLYLPATLTFIDFNELIIGSDQ